MKTSEFIKSIYSPEIVLKLFGLLDDAHHIPMVVLFLPMFNCGVHVGEQVVLHVAVHFVNAFRLL